MSRHVEDAALALGVASGRGRAYLRAARAGSLRGARFGWLQGYDELLEPSQRGAAESALATLRRAGATVESVVVPRVFTLPAQYPGELFALLYEFKRDLDAYLATATRASARTLADIVRFNRAHPREELRFGQNLMEMAAAVDLRRDAARYAAQAARPAEVHRGVLEGALRQGPFDGLLFAGPDGPPLVDPPGYPAVMVPIGGRGGPPVGLAFAGRPRTEARLLAYARAFERARG
jgi:amidase